MFVVLSIKVLSWPRLLIFKSVYSNGPCKIVITAYLKTLPADTNTNIHPVPLPNMKASLRATGSFSRVAAMERFPRYRSEPLIR